MQLETIIVIGNRQLMIGDDGYDYICRPVSVLFSDYRSYLFDA